MSELVEMKGVDDKKEVLNEVLNEVINGIDTTDVFHQVFQNKTAFESWEEFITPFEEFQIRTNSVFKPKSSVCVNWINEKRATDKIPEKFVYSKVNMICQHYGLGIRKAGSTRKRESYVGQDCEAVVKLSYKKGSLHIIKFNLVHTNHTLDKANVETQMRKIRPVIFTDDLDMIICKSADEHNVFENRSCETNWQSAVHHLQNSDTQLEHLTRRILKKRLQFLMDRYDDNCEGNDPLPGDDLGILLYKLLKQKKKLNTPQLRGRKRKSGALLSEKPRKRGRGRPKKYANEDQDDEDFGEIDFLIEDDDFHLSPTTRGGSSSKRHRSMNDIEIGSFLSYWTERDADERKLRWEEMQIRRDELDLQKKKFELEQEERLTLMELLKTQGQLVSNLRKHVVPARLPVKASSTTKEFILNRDGSLHPMNCETAAV